MSFTGRTIQVWWDVTRQSLLTSAGNLQVISPGMNYLENVLVQIQFVDGSISTFKAITGYSTGGANIDNTFNDAANLAVQSTNAQVNVAGDWVGSGNADPTQGQFTVRLNGNTTNAITKLGSGANLTGSKLECLGYASDGSICFAQRFPFNLFNLQDDSGGSGPPATVGRNWIDAQQIAGLYALRIGLGGQTIILVSPDGTKAREIGCRNDGTFMNNLIDPYSSP